MDTTPNTIKTRTVRGAVALGAAGLLVAGATWVGSAAEPVHATSPTATAVAEAQQTPAVVSRGAAVGGGRDSYADIVKNIAPAVVTIRTEGKARVSPTQFDGDEDMMRRFFGERFGQGQGQAPGRQMPRTPKQRGLGSGVVITADGYILTNNHVIDAADDIQIEFIDGRTAKAKLIGADKPSDLALLKVEQTGLATLALGNSDAVQVGDVVLAVGNPLGIGQTVTMGIISAKGRSTGNGDGSYEDFLQTDAPINHGNSGGALVDTTGALMGINTAIYSRSGGSMGIGFAIPVSTAKQVLDSIVKEGQVTRGWIGVEPQELNAELMETFNVKTKDGVIITGVLQNGPAGQAGIKPGDVITAVNGKAVGNVSELLSAVAALKPGVAAPLSVQRAGKTSDISVTPAKRQRPKTPN